ncbi:hypothetical protein, partial [Aeromonas enteropelogenes]|uniref:hypothetical protein n=1 Tax=Aeromonas enteropelogenes TaxID=29489 RepID=UPI003BA1444B
MTERKKADTNKLEQKTKVEVAHTDMVEANTQQITCGLIMPIAGVVSQISHQAATARALGERYTRGFLT